MMSLQPLKRLFLLLAAAAVCGAAAPCPAADATDRNNEGVEALERDDYAAAISALTAALALEPDSGTIRNNLATAYNNYGVVKLQAGEFEAAIAALKAAAELVPADEQVRTNLARAYNSRGVGLIDEKNYTAAENYLLEAIRQQPAEPTFRRNLSVAMTHYARAFYDARDRGTAFAKLREALQYDAQNAGAMVLLGQICYERQNLGWALYYLRAAYQLEPRQYPELAGRIKQLEREANVEGQFSQEDYGAFDIRYDSDLGGFDVKALRAHLSHAYYNVGSAFGYYPRQKVVVIVYDADDFAKLRSQPEWVAGFYDGKIRVPADGAQDAKEFKRLIHHEYTHAVVGALSKERCAVWLNEGLAKYMEYAGERGGMPTPTLKRAVRAGRLLSFDSLQGQFVTIKERETVQLAYEESYMIVSYITDTYGLWKIKRMLAGYAAGDDTTTILAREFRRTPAQFEADYLRYIRRHLD